mgnify:CR=1 FL=1
MKTRDLFVAALSASNGVVVQPLCNSVGCGNIRTHDKHVKPSKK